MTKEQERAAIMSEANPDDASQGEKSTNEQDAQNEKAISEHQAESGGGSKFAYLVRGALLKCSEGAFPAKLNLPLDHGVYITQKPVAHYLNAEPIKNIPSFGICSKTQKPCIPNIVGVKWRDTFPKTRIVDNGEKNPGDRAIANNDDPDGPQPKGEDSIVTISFLVCLLGGMIEPLNSGQGIFDVIKLKDNKNELNQDALKNMLLDLGWDEEELTDDNITDLFNAITEFNITTKDRLGHFLSQVSEETNYGQWKIELGSDDYLVNMYWNNQNKAKELGNLSAWDAIHYSGGGYIQLTGRYNYQQFSDYMKSLGHEDKEIMSKGREVIAEKYPWRASAYWWETSGINDAIDNGATVLDVSRKCNIGPNATSGTPNHLQERIDAYNKITKILEDYDF